MNETSAPEQLDYAIENVGGVERLELKLKPGVSVLRGKNGQGKTSAIRAMSRAHGGSVPVEKRDGSQRGWVYGPGVKLLVKKVASQSGDAEVELADTGPLARLIDPGIKDSEKAANARLRALAELLHLEASDELIARLAGDDDDLAEDVKAQARDTLVGDLLGASELLRKRAHAKRRECESVVDEATARAKVADEGMQTVAESVGAAKLPALTSAPPADEAGKALEEAIRQHDRALTQCEAAEKLDRQKAEIRASLGDEPDVAAAIAAREETHRKLNANESDIESLRAKLRELEAEAHIHRSQLAIDQKRVEEAEADLFRWERQRAILDQDIDAPTREDVERMRVELVDTARERLAIAEKAETYRLHRERLAQAETEIAEAEKGIEHYRELVDEIPARLGEILAESGATGITVVDGRLHALRDGGVYDFEKRCSTGQRVALALDIAAKAYEGRVLPLDGELWTALDPDARAHFDELARERGLFVITEEAAEGELRVESV